METSAGVYRTMLGHRQLGRNPGGNLKYARWHDQHGARLTTLKPLVVRFGAFLALKGLVGR